MDSADLNRYSKSLAAEMGFDRCGVARAEPSGRRRYLRAWLDSGRAGSMEYLHRHFAKRTDSSELLEGARSIIVMALSYHQPVDTEALGDRCPQGRVAMYGWGDDYHEVIRAKLSAMTERMHTDLPDAFRVKACVDTAPLLEREVAAAAGIGWIGKNTLVVDRQLGSYFFLAELVTTLDIAPDRPMRDRCGTCTACLEACPTGAFPAPFEMDASRCVSYLTVEHRGKIREDLQPLMGDWVFGCDVCQQVCPYNRRAPATTEPRFAIRSPGPRPVLDEILAWTPEDYCEKLRGSATRRASLDMWQRNARIARNNASLPKRPECPVSAQDHPQLLNPQ